MQIIFAMRYHHTTLELLKFTSDNIKCDEYLLFGD